MAMDSRTIEPKLKICIEGLKNLHSKLSAQDKSSALYGYAALFANQYDRICLWAHDVKVWDSVLDKQLRMSSSLRDCIWELLSDLAEQHDVVPSETTIESTLEEVTDIVDNLISLEPALRSPAPLDQFLTKIPEVLTARLPTSTELSHGIAVATERLRFTNNKADLDIVVVPGPIIKESTWSAALNSFTRLLPDVLEENGVHARIMSFSYTLKHLSIKLVDDETLDPVVNKLVQDLNKARYGDPERPLFFIGLSLGGILAKGAISTIISEGIIVNIERPVCGCMFLAVPHDIERARIELWLSAVFGANISPDYAKPLIRFNDVFARDALRHQIDVSSFYTANENISTIVPLPNTEEATSKLIQSTFIPMDRETILPMAHAIARIAEPFVSIQQEEHELIYSGQMLSVKSGSRQNEDPFAMLAAYDTAILVNDSSTAPAPDARQRLVSHMPETEIVGNLAAVTGLFDKAKAVIDKFGSRNPDVSPDALCRLYFLLALLKDGEVHVFAEQHKLSDLKGYLERCSTLLEQHRPPAGRATCPGTLSYAWPANSEAELRSLIAKIDHEILWLQFVACGSRPSWQFNNFPSPELPSEQAAIRAANVRLGERKDSINFIELSVTITLRQSPHDKNPKEFEMRWINIAERDDAFRTLQFKKSAGYDPDDVVISHRIHRHKLPLVDELLRATRVEFQKPQEVIVHTKDGHKIYELYPVYRFEKPEILDSFIQKVRERDLRAKLQPSWIYLDDKKNSIARSKVVRLWEKDGVPSDGSSLLPDPEITLTFLTTSLNQEELDLADYELATLSKDTKAVDIKRKADLGVHHSETFTFSFGNKERAKEFRDTVNKFHPDGERRYRLPKIDQHRFRPPIDFNPESVATSTSPLSTSISTTSPISGTPSTSIGAGSYPATAGPSVFLSEPTMPRGRQDFAVAIICALPMECDAVKATFDQGWDNGSYGKAHGDRNRYSFGSIGQIHVVLVHMPGVGKGRASSAATHCQMSFTNIKLCLIVGICGGLPLNTERERKAITLGDVVISQGVVQYDLGRQHSDRFKSREDRRFRPEDSLLSLLSMLEGLLDREHLQDATARHLDRLGQGMLGDKARYPAPPAEDWLFEANYRHRHRDDVGCEICRNCRSMTDPACEEAEETPCVDLRCNEGRIIRRGGAETPITWVRDQGSLDDTGPSQSSTDMVIKRSGRPVVHFGVFASGDRVIKSGVERDRIAQNEGIIAFEMEAAGAWSSFPGRCLVIKGVCDYADTHKNKDFQRYAAAAAAACTKAFLKEWARGRDEDNGGRGCGDGFY